MEGLDELLLNMYTGLRNSQLFIIYRNARRECLATTARSAEVQALFELQRYLLQSITK